MDRQVLTVSQVNYIARSALEEICVWVEGEVDSYKDGYRSAIYFDLKDGVSTLPCTLWKSEDAGYLPKNGEKVMIYGTLSLWEKAGRYQMKVAKIEPFGEGELLKRREELRKKLLAEGYFDEGIKREIPYLPIKIGIISSKQGVVIEDFRANVVKNFEGFELYFVDALVQGDKAVKSITDAFKRIAKLDLDVVVLARGGGSIEDLMCFNTEEVVKAIRACPYPVISAVGHEVDYTLADLAADLRVSTPTKAAEYISAQFAEFRNAWANEFADVENGAKRLYDNFGLELDSIESTLKRVWGEFKAVPQELAYLLKALNLAFHKLTSNKEANVSSLMEKMSALNPEKVLTRGYSIAYIDGKLLKSVAQVNLGAKLKVRLVDGNVLSKVESKNHD